MKRQFIRAKHMTMQMPSLRLMTKEGQRSVQVMFQTTSSGRTVIICFQQEMVERNAAKD